ncbi:MAG: LLM class flavin-dependent oxidoreductase [Gammaproteobacteria bacterium]|nr:LLM class flavin-dependent oxidoreductase [Gammaproteobacteria bacterium]
MELSLVVMNPLFLEGHWEALDRTGFEAIYLVDHPYMDTPDPWPMLSYMAAKTERIKLGTHVTAAPMHHPTELASAVATADVVSNGRVRLGIGAGYNHKDFEPFGFGTRPSAGKRLDRMDEMIQITKMLWSATPVNFKGDYFEFTGGTLMNPKPVQNPGPPIIIGVNIPGKALDIAVREADEINTWQLGPTAIAALAEEARERREKAGRSALRVTSDALVIRGGNEQAATDLVEGIKDMARSGGRAVKATNWDHGGVLFGEAAQIIEQIDGFKKAGVEELSVSLGTVEDVTWFDSEVLSAL